MAEYISKQSVINYLNGYLHSLGEGGTDDLLFDRGQRRALINAIQDISAVKAADVQILKREKWKEILEILRDAVEELEYYETHGDILDRHIWKYKDEALALIGEDGEQNG